MTPVLLAFVSVARTGSDVPRTPHAIAPAAIRGAAKQRAGAPSTTANRLSEASRRIGRYERTLGEAVARWEVWWRRRMNDPSVVGPRDREEAGRRRAALGAALDPKALFGTEGRGGWPKERLARLETALAGLRARGERLHTAQVAALEAFAAGGAEAGDMAERADAEMATATDLYREVAFALEGVGWLDHDAYDEVTSPPINAAWIARIPFGGLLPDPDRPEGCTIGWARPELRRLQGARIAGYRAPKARTWIEPPSWEEFNFTLLILNGFPAGDIALRLVGDEGEFSVLVPLVPPPALRGDGAVSGG